MTKKKTPKYRLLTNFLRKPYTSWYILGTIHQIFRINNLYTFFKLDDDEIRCRSVSYRQISHRMLPVPIVNHLFNVNLKPNDSLKLYRNGSYYLYVQTLYIHSANLHSLESSWPEHLEASRGSNSPPPSSRLNSTCCTFTYRSYHPCCIPKITYLPYTSLLERIESHLTKRETSVAIGIYTILLTQYHMER